jgi:mitotic spindle assembly checkpoint protein MAD2B
MSVVVGATHAEVIDAVIDLLEAVTHSILYHRNVYPRSSFKLTNKYNVCTPMSRAANLCDYISTRLAELRPLLLHGVVDAYVVTIVAVKSRLVVERFEFQLASVDRSLAPHAPLTLTALESQLRPFLTTLSTSSARLVQLALSPDTNDVPEAEMEADYVFNLAFEANDGVSASENEAVAQHWVPENVAPPDDSVPLLVAFKSASLGSVHVQLVCKENRAAKAAPLRRRSDEEERNG